MMNNPFQNLNRAMKNTVFKDVTFSNERKEAVKEAIRAQHHQTELSSWKEETIHSILQLLQHEPKKGFDISNQLLQHNELSFQQNEGQLYTLLHLLENKELLESHWEKDQKYYSLSLKGKKWLSRFSQGSVKHRLALHSLVEEVSQ